MAGRRVKFESHHSELLFGLDHFINCSLVPTRIDDSKSQETVRIFPYYFGYLDFVSTKTWRGFLA